MTTELLMIPGKDIKKILPDMLTAFFEGFDSSIDNLPKDFMKDEVSRFRKIYKNNLTEGKYCLALSDMQSFAHKSFEALVNHTVMGMVKSNDIEMGVNADGEMTFWHK